MLCANYLVRAPSTYFLTVNINSDSAAPAYTGNLNQAIQGYIDSLALGEEFVVADMLAAIQMPGVILPVTVDYTYYGTDSTVASGSFTDYQPYNTVSVATAPQTGTPQPPTGLFQFVLENVNWNQITIT